LLIIIIVLFVIYAHNHALSVCVHFLGCVAYEPCGLDRGCKISPPCLPTECRQRSDEIKCSFSVLFCILLVTFWLYSKSVIFLILSLILKL